MDYDKLTAAINIFYKRASLLSDMAHRIMFSLSPPGEFNITAARWAAAGSKDMIIYATKSCLDEIEYYGIGRSGTHEAIKIKKLLKHYEPAIKLNKTLTKENYNIYNEILKLCLISFKHKAGWSSTIYGGPAWEKIAKTTLELLLLYIDWRSTTKDTIEEETIIKKLLIKMNLFDGLIHNTSSIYNNMIKLEHHDTEGVPKSIEDQENITKKFKKLMEMRNISEAYEPAMTYKSIKDILSPTVPHQDTIQKIVTDPEYFQKHNLDQFSKDITSIKELIGSDYHLIDVETLVESVSASTECINNSKLIFNTYLKDEKTISLHKFKIIEQLKKIDNNINSLKDSMLNIDRSIKLLSSILESIKSPKLQTKSIILARKNLTHLELSFNYIMKETYILIKEITLIIHNLPINSLKNILIKFINNYTNLINNLVPVCNEFENFIETLKGI